MLKRMLTALIGIPFSVIVLVFANKYVVDIIAGILAVMGIYEVFKCLQNKFKPVYWIGFLSCLIIPFIQCRFQYIFDGSNFIFNQIF